MSEHTQNQPEITKDYELHNIVTGDMAAAALVSLLRGDDPTAAVAEWTVGTEGAPTETAADLGQIRGELKQLRLQRVETAVDSDGKTLLEQFQVIMSKLIAERLNKDVEAKVTNGLAYIAELTDIIENTTDDDERQQAQTRLEKHRGYSQMSPKPIRFVTDYHGIQSGYQGNSRADNGIIEEALDRLYDQRFAAIDSTEDSHSLKVDAEAKLDNLFEQFNGLFPSKLGFEVSASGTIAIDLDGKQLELTAAQ